MQNIHGYSYKMLHRVPKTLELHIHRYELPEQHEPLVVLIPEDGAPHNGMDSDSLAEEIKRRRAEGATATLVFDGALRNMARESGLLFEHGIFVAADPLSAKGSAYQLKYIPRSTIFDSCTAVLENHYFLPNPEYRLF